MLKGVNKTYIYHNGFRNEHVKKTSGGLTDVINSQNLLNYDCFSSVSDGKFTRSETLVDKYRAKLNGYITYEIENFFIIIQICADYCEVYNGSTNNKYKIVMNTSYNLLSPNDYNNGDIYIKSDGFLGPYFNKKHDGLTLVLTNKQVIHNIILESYNIIIEMPYVERERPQSTAYIPPNIRGKNLEHPIDKPVHQTEEYKVLITDYFDLEDYYIINFPKTKLTEKELFDNIHSKFIIKDISDEIIYDNYIKWFNDHNVYKKYLKYKKNIYY